MKNAYYINFTNKHQTC